MKGNTKEGRASALLPILVFLLIFLGSGFITGNFYSMPAIAAFLIALLVAFVQNRELSFSEKIRLAAEGVGDENIITMCLIFLAAGAFTGAVKAAGGVWCVKQKPGCHTTVGFLIKPESGWIYPRHWGQKQYKACLEP